MKRVFEFLNNLGLENGLELSDEGLLELKNEAMNMDISLPENRKLLIYNFTETFDPFFLLDWKSSYSEKNIDEDLKNRIDTFVYSVLIKYNNFTNDFDYEIDKGYLEGMDEQTDLSKEQEILEFLSPGWEIRNIFLDNDKRIECSEQTLIDSVKKVVEKRNIINELYDKFPELLRDGIIKE